MFKELTLAEAARIAGGVLEGDENRTFASVAQLEHAGPADLSFWDGRQNVDLSSARAAGVIVPFDFTGNGITLNLLRCYAPHQSILAIGQELWRRNACGTKGVASSAVVHPLAKVSPTAYVGPQCVIEERATIGDGTALHTGSVIAAGASIGANSIIQSRVFIGGNVTVGERCVIHAGCVLGFTYRPNVDSALRQKNVSLGCVIIEDDVEIGPNSVVECGETRATYISTGARIGALSMIGHDCYIGPNAELVSMVGLAGEAHVEAEALLLGQVGVSSRVRIGKGAVVLAKSGVSRKVPAGEIYTGIPARSRAERNRTALAVRALPETLRRIDDLEQSLNELRDRMQNS